MKTYDVKLITWVQIKAPDKWQAMDKAIDAAESGALNAEFQGFSVADDAVLNEYSDE